MASERLAGPLLAEVPAPSYEEWRRRVLDELGGVAFEEALVSASPEGIVRQPLYTAADLPREGDAAGFPGLAPFTRGARPATAGWKVAREVAVEDVGAANAELRAGVEAGVELVWLRLRPDLSSDGLYGLLDGVDLGRLAVVLDSSMAGRASGATAGRACGATAAAAPPAELLLAAAERHGFAAERLRGGFGANPLAAAEDDLDAAFAKAAELCELRRRRCPGMRALLVSTAPYHRAGASAVAELAFAVAGGVELLRRIGASASRDILFALHAGGDFFVEIAKLRAARLLWAKVTRAVGGETADVPMSLHIRGAAATRTVRDPWSNLLRASAETFAAAVGGAESVAPSPHDALLAAGMAGRASGATGRTGRRLAVHLQHVLREEAHAGRVLDPAGGSYYVERLTDELARAAWKLFRDVERGGGMARALADGRVAEIVAGSARERLAAAGRRQAGIVGVSEFPDLAETTPAAAPEEPSPWPVCRPAAAFEDLHRASERYRDRHGHRPRAFLARVGTPAEYGARAAFAAQFFAAGGIEAVGGGSSAGEELFAELPEAFARSGAEIAAVCSSDELYADVVERLVPALRERGARLVAVAGRGAEREAAYREAGVDHFLYRGADVTAVLGEVLAALGEDE